MRPRTSALPEQPPALGAGDQVVVGRVGGVGGLGDEVGAGVVAEHEANPVGVPAVELGGEGEVGVAPQQDVGVAGSPAQGDSTVVQGNDPFVGGPVGAPQGQVERLVGVGQ